MLLPLGAYCAHSHQALQGESGPVMLLSLQGPCTGVGHWGTGVRCRALLSALLY